MSTNFLEHKTNYTFLCQKRETETRFMDIDGLQFFPTNTFTKNMGVHERWIVKISYFRMSFGDIVELLRLRKLNIETKSSCDDDFNSISLLFI